MEPHQPVSPPPACQDEPPAKAGDIEPSPDWWAAWNELDYSWSGLAEKPWEGWFWNTAAARAVPAGSETGDCVPGTLQHQWWRHRDALFVDPVDGRAYTVAHLPLLWSDGSRSPKTDSAHSAEVDNELTLAIHDLMDACAGGTVDLSGVVFGSSMLIPTPSDRPVRLLLKKVYADGSLTLRSKDAGPARLAELSIESSFLKRDVSLDNATIEGRMRLINGRGTEIGGDLNCQGLKVRGRLLARFGIRRRARFEGAVFEDEARFEDCVFFSWADFTDARFRGPAFFSRSIIDEARFWGSTFEGFGEFVAVAFRRRTDFSGSAFAGNAIFAESAFGHSASFAGAAFGSDLNLHHTRFEGPVDFSGRAALATDRNPQIINLRREGISDDGPDRWVGGLAAEDMLAAFARRSFQKIDASEAVFVRDADFSNRDILQPSNFAGARFLGDARFHGSRLHQRVNLHDTRFEALDYEALPPGARRVGGRWPDASLVAVDADRRIDSKAPLRALKDRPDEFGVAVEAFRDELVEARRSMVAEVLTPDGKRQTDARLESLEASFRTLKLAMEDTRARLSESRFFKMELRARRRRRDAEVPAWERFASMAYGVTADYGDSIARPLIFFVAMGLVFSLAYWVLAALGIGSAVSLDGLGNALRYSLSRMTPFGAMQDQDSWAWLDGWQNTGSLFSWAGLIRITATIQSAFALVLTFLFALAVRRRFQIV